MTAKVRLNRSPEVLQRLSNLSGYEQDLYTSIVAQAPLIVMRKNQTEDTQNLLFQGDIEQPKEKKEKVQMINHVRDEVFFQLIHDVNDYDSRQLPPHIQQLDVTFSPHLGVYRPVLDDSQFWCRSHTVYDP